MGTRINTNVEAMNAMRFMGISTNKLARSIERLSSGLRINKAADDAAGLTISEKLRSQIKGLNQASRNAQDGISLIQTAEGALNEVHSILQRMRELAVQAANGTLTDTDRSAIQSEIATLKAEINRISTATEFNTKKLLNGDSGVSASAVSGSVNFVSGTEATTAGTYDVNLTTAPERANVQATAAMTGPLTNAEVLTIQGVQIALASGLNAAAVAAEVNNYTAQTGVVAWVGDLVKTLDDGATTPAVDQLVFTANVYGSAVSISVVSDTPAGAGTTQVGTTTLTDTGVDAAGNYVKDSVNSAFTAVGINITANSGTQAEGLAVYLTAQAYGSAFAVGSAGTVTVANNSLQFQLGANYGQTASLAIQVVNSSSLRNTTLGVSISDIDVSTVSGAEEALQVVDSALSQVSSTRSSLGAFQNRLEHTIANLDVAAENLTASESRIRDVDMAAEMVNFTVNQILSQAGTAVLAQANVAPQGVLQLLR